MPDLDSQRAYCSHERLLPQSVGKRVLLTVAGFIAVLLVGMEIKARQDDYPVNFPFTSDMWVAQWQRLDDLPDNQTVFVGASRVRHGLVVDEWAKLTGERPLNLAWPGSPAGPVLTELAERESFRGTVIVGLTSFVVFANDGPPWMSWIKQNIEQSETTRWSLSFHLSHATQHYLRPRIKCINDAAYSPISLMYENFPIPNRTGMLKPVIFRFIGTTDRDLQDRYLDSFEQDDELQEEICKVLYSFFERMLHYGKCDLEKRIREYRAAIDRIENRGGRVVFVRFPSDGKSLDFENEQFPRGKYYDRLVKETGCLGIHYQDHAELRDFRCVEESHLSKGDGIAFTKCVVEILRRDGVLE